VSSRRPAPPTGTQHDGTWYGIPGSVWPGWGWASPPGCAPSWILVKINPVLAEPRTAMEQLTLESISRHMQVKKVVRSSQHGFTMGKSCLTNMITIY